MIDLNAYPAGLYQLQLVTGQGIGQQLILKQ
jgi:hypothetical protein